MQTKEQSQLASVIILLVGIWVAISPIWISMSAGARISTIITGIVIAIAGIVQFFLEESIPSWISGIAAVWLFISAFLFGATTGQLWSNILSAIAIFIVSYWDGMKVRQLSQHHHAQ